MLIGNFSTLPLDVVNISSGVLLEDSNLINEISNDETIAEKSELDDDLTSELEELNPELSENPDKDGEDDKENEDETDPPEEEIFDFGTGLIIKAFNPGYTQNVDGKSSSDFGEFIELQNLTNAPIALAGYSLKYDYGNGSYTFLFTFPEGSYMTGKRLLLKYTKTYDAAESDLTYKKSLAMDAGPLQLIYTDEDEEEYLVDSVCWRGEKDKALCEGYNYTPKLVSTIGKRKVVVRNLVSGEFEQFPDIDYIPDFVVNEAGLVISEESSEEPVEEKAAPHCQGLEITELLTYYDQDKSEQFVEIFNPTAQEINLEGCQIGYKKKFYQLVGVIKSGEYYVYYPSAQFTLTKNPKNPTSLTLLDADDSVVDEIVYPNGQKKSTSFAKIFTDDGKDDWQITYAITPGKENVYQKFRSCEAGKIINEATGNCVKVTTIKSAANSLAPCPAGKYRNPLTGRCKNIETTKASTAKACAEGYERNPETNRCRKIKQENDGAEHALVPTTRSNQTTFVGVGIVLLITSLGIGYVILQFRHEIARAARKAGQRINHVCKDLLARGIGRHPHK